MERGFSRGGLTVSKRRHSLSDASIQAATVLSSWAEIPGLVPEEKIIAVFKNKSKRAKEVVDVDEIEDEGAGSSSQATVAIPDTE